VTHQTQAHEAVDWKALANKRERDFDVRGVELAAVKERADTLAAKLALVERWIARWRDQKSTHIDGEWAHSSGLDEWAHAARELESILKERP
jgi:hypothetical protein